MINRTGKNIFCIILSAIVVMAMSPSMGLSYAEEKADDDVLTHQEELFLENLGDSVQIGNAAFDFQNDEQVKNAVSEDMPPILDLRDFDLVTPVKFQNPFGSCWGFGAIAAAETSLISSGLASEDGYDKDTLNLSEKHLVYFLTQPISDKSDPQYGEGLVYKKNYTTQQKLNLGGFPFEATSLFASGMGVNLEDRAYPESSGQTGTMEDILGYHGKNKEIYKTKVNGKWVDYCYDEDDDWDIDEEYRFLQSYTLKESCILPSPANQIVDEEVLDSDEEAEYEYNEAGTEAIKSELNEGRAVEIGFYADTYRPGQGGEPQYISDKWAHYTYKVEPANHAVTIVGYDDNYPKENFLEGHQPEEDGAFLVKNSWGSEEEDFPNKGPGWGLLQDPDEEYDPETNVHTGYFWLSYYDQSISMPESFEFDKSNIGKTYYLDQHDYMPANTAMSIPTEDKVASANVFKAEDAEKLEAVSCITSTPGTVVKYEIYLLADNYESPTDGVKAAEFTSNDSYTYGGFHKETLAEHEIKPITVQKGQCYSIITTATAKDENNKDIYDLSVNMGFGESIAKFLGQEFYSKGVINKGESYLGYGDENSDKFSFIDTSTEGVFDALLGEGTEAMTEFDNFPIKGFCEPADNSLKIKVTGNDIMSLVGEPFEGEDEITLKTSITGKGELDPDAAISYEIADPTVAQITPNTNNDTKCDVKALKYGTTYLKVSVEGVGTTIVKIEVLQHHLQSMEIDEAKQVYNGKAHDVWPTVYDTIVTGDEDFYTEDYIELKEGTDYTIKYKNNVNAGTATITAIGKGNYTGSITKKFKIYKAANPLKVTGKTATVKRSKVKKKSQTLKVTRVIKTTRKGKGTVTYQKAKGNKKITVAKSGKVTVKKGLKKGTYTVKVKVKAKGTSNYNPKTTTVTFKVKVK